MRFIQRAPDGAIIHDSALPPTGDELPPGTAADEHYYQTPIGPPGEERSAASYIRDQGQVRAYQAHMRRLVEEARRRNG